MYINKLTLIGCMCFVASNAFADTQLMLPKNPGPLHIHYSVDLVSPALPSNIADQAIQTIKKRGILSKSDNSEIEYLTLKKITMQRMRIRIIGQTAMASFDG